MVNVVKTELKETKEELKEVKVYNLKLRKDIKHTKISELNVLSSINIIFRSSSTNSWKKL